VDGARDPAQDPEDDVDHQMQHPLVAAVDEDGHRWDEDGEDALDDLLGGPLAAAAPLGPDQQPLHGRRLLGRTLLRVAQQSDGVAFLYGNFVRKLGEGRADLDSQGFAIGRAEKARDEQSSEQDQAHFWDF
jgi:hypothetical protein